MTPKFERGDRVYCKEFNCGGVVNGSEGDQCEVTMDIPTVYGIPPKKMWTLRFFARDLKLESDYQCQSVP